ncbi:Uncharacterised protein [Mycolicibacterium aichiense]|nr:Uncharacterised protein [Mycolicibacterium aichiense]
MLWHNNPEPAEAEYRIVQGTGVGSMGSVVRDYERMVDTMLGSRFQSTITSIRDQLLGKDARRELVKPGETFIGHLVRLTWLEETPGSGEEPGLVLTELGRALLRDRERGATEEDVSVVVLEGQDPLAYPILVGQLANAGAGLLIDPYLKLDGLHRIVVSTQLTRLLVSGKRSNNAELSAMQTHLDSASLSRPVEVRKSTKLHDRILLTEDGAVLTLGTSLNSVGTTTTVMSPMPSPARESLRELCEQLWSEATLVGPQIVEVEPDDDGLDEENNGGEQNCDGGAVPGV